MADTPGAGGVYQSLAPLFERGYKVVIRVPKTAQKQPADPPAFSDPRGILPASLVPGSQISYQIIDQVSELAVVNNFEAASGNISLGFQLIGQVTVNSKSTISLICFEGRDVIDLSTEKLKLENGGLRVPDKVFLPIYAGGKFIGPDDDFGRKTSLEYIKRSDGNVVTGIIPSENPPLDSLSHTDGIFPTNFAVNKIDVASDTIALNGSAQFVSYVACDKPLFRDVVTLNSSAIGQGIFTSGNHLMITFAGPYGTPIVTVFRYAFINFEKDPKLPARFQWRLSESFGAFVENVDKTPSGLTLTPEERAADFLEDQSKHYVYNLNDDGVDTDKNYPHKPIKKGYSPAFAKVKTDPASPFYDPDFKAQAIPFAKNQFFFQSRLEARRIFGLSQTKNGTTGPNKLVQDRTYQSPIHLLDLGPDTRLGVEYIVHQFSHSKVFGVDDVIVLAATKPAIDGIGVYYDPCVKMLVVILIEGETIVQRLFNDKQWAISTATASAGKLKAFLLGETTEQTGGPTAIMPPSTDLGLSVFGTSGSITIPQDSVATGFEITPAAKGDKPAILELFADTDITGDPIYETRITPGVTTISIPAIAFKGYNIVDPNGAQLKKVLGAKKAFLEAMVIPTPPEIPTSFSKLAAYQLAVNKEDDFPMKASGATTAGLSLYGSSLIAYESQNRIDIAYRPSIAAPFLVIRDVCFRVPDSLTPPDVNAVVPDVSQQAFPSANLPFLLPIRQISSILLFYEYKKRILMKTIPSTIFSSLDTIVKNSKFNAITESTIAAQIMSLVPVIVYDGNLEDNKEGLEADVAFGSVAVLPALKLAAGTQKNTDKPRIMQHSACRTKGGIIYSFVQDDIRIRVRRSSNSGQNWQDVFSDKATFIPAKKDEVEVKDGDSPYCFYDLSTQKILLFFIADNALLMMHLTEELLFQPMDAADKSLKKIIPSVIYGNVSENLKDRRVQAQSTVLQRKKASDTFSEAVSPHRVAIGRLDGGHLRLFFTDEQKKLRTLISSDSGNLWQTEDQFVKSR